jgi:hypothetical protein
VVLPAEYQAARAEVEAARRARLDAEAKWRELPKPLAPWAADAAVALIVIVAAAATTASLIAWACYGYFKTVRDMLVLGVFTPLFLLVLGLIEAIASRSYARHVEALAALPPPGEGKPPRCRLCGAPLHLEPAALAATCGYCLADSLVTRLSSRRRAWLAEQRRTVELQLEAAVSALSVGRADHKLVRVITLVVLVACWLGFWFALPH